MRKVTREVMQAFLEGDFKRVSNSHTHNYKAYLHDNLIAQKTQEGYELSMAGWPSRTTCERLNGLLELLGSPWHFSSAKGGVLRGDGKEYDISTTKFYRFNNWGNCIDFAPTYEIDFNEVQ